MAHTNDPGTFYEEQLTIARDRLSAVRRNITVLGWLRLSTLLPPAAGIWQLLHDRSGLWWLMVALGACLFILFMNLHTRARQKELEWQTMTGLLEDELRVLDGDFTHHPSGRRFVNPGHPFSYDLDLFGKGSVYQLLCRTVTFPGSERLGALLQDPLVSGAGEAATRQSIIKELGDRPDFLLQYRVAGRMHPENAGDFEKMMEWLKQPDLFATPKILTVLILVVPVLSTAAMAYSFYTGGWHPFLGLAVALNWLLFLLYRKRITEAFYFSGKTAGLVRKYAALLQVTESGSFAHKELQRSAALARDAIKSIRALGKLVQRIENRQNPFVGPLMNSLFLYDLRNARALGGWKRRQGAVLYEALADSGKFDVLVSLATYAFHHPLNTYPEVQEMQVPVIEGQNVKHPLLDPATAVGNDFVLGRDEQLYLLTGANMTGKSTFIRTIGVSMVLAYSGLPLPAEHIRIPVCRLFTSMRVTDSVQDDISYFKAELNRMKDMLLTVRSRGYPCLVLLDEPLRGTNSGDKQAGTEAIILKLIGEGAIGIIATHDTSLSRLQEDLPGKLRNYHFESAVERNELIFDFKLKEGCSSSNNATLLMKQMGIV